MKPKIVFHESKMKIAVKTGFIACRYRDLMYVVYKDLYCTLHFVGNIKHKIETTLKYMADHLPRDIFVICNRNTILNLLHCKGYDRVESEIVMDDGAVFALSRRNVANFKAKIKNPLHTLTCTNCHTPVRIADVRTK